MISLFFYYIQYLDFYNKLNLIWQDNPYEGFCIT